MSNLSIQEIRGWEVEAITKKTNELRVELFNLLMQRTTSGIEKPHLVKVIKKNIARLLTIETEKGRK